MGVYTVSLTVSAEAYASLESTLSYRCNRAHLDHRGQRYRRINYYLPQTRFFDRRRSHAIFAEATILAGLIHSLSHTLPLFNPDFGRRTGILRLILDGAQIPRTWLRLPFPSYGPGQVGDQRKSHREGRCGRGGLVPGSKNKGICRNCMLKQTYTEEVL